MRTFHNLDLATVQLLNALQGAPLTCLVGLYIAHPMPVGRAEIAMLTGYSAPTITRCMNLLVNVFHLAARMARYESWCLTDKGYQLRLPLFSGLFNKSDTRAPDEVKIFSLEPSSSSGFISNLSG